MAVLKSRLRARQYPEIVCEQQPKGKPQLKAKKKKTYATEGKTTTEGKEKRKLISTISALPPHGAVSKLPETR